MVIRTGIVGKPCRWHASRARAIRINTRGIYGLWTITPRMLPGRARPWALSPKP